HLPDSGAIEALRSHEVKDGVGFLDGSEVRKGFRELGCLGGGEPAGVHEVFHHEVGIRRCGDAYSGGKVDRGGEEEEISKAAGFEQGQKAIAAEYRAERRSRHCGTKESSR
ncbi:unnamed protein product, partial [Musa hybrid cultivar]